MGIPVLVLTWSSISKGVWHMPNTCLHACMVCMGYAFALLRGLYFDDPELCPHCPLSWSGHTLPTAPVAHWQLGRCGSATASHSGAVLSVWWSLERPVATFWPTMHSGQNAIPAARGWRRKPEGETVLWLDFDWLHWEMPTPPNPSSAVAAETARLLKWPGWLCF